MTGDRDPARQGDYRAARIGASAAFTAVLVVLLVIDALSPSYDVSAVVLIPMLGTIAGLLGIETISVLRGGK